MKRIIHLLIVGLSIFFAAYLFPDLVKVNNFWTALLAALIFGIVNITIKPILLIIAFPINILTLGLFKFVINAFMLLIVAIIVPGFEVSGFIAALIGSVFISATSTFLSFILRLD